MGLAARLQKPGSDHVFRKTWSDPDSEVVLGAGGAAAGSLDERKVELSIEKKAVPMMLTGIFLGNRVHTGLSEIAFRRMVSVALIVSGLALLAKAG